MHPHWAESLRDQCVDAGTAFFFKQWGNWIPVDGETDTEPEQWARYAEDAPDNWRSQPHRFLCVDIDGQYRDGYGYHGERFMRRVPKHVAGRLLDGREWNEMPA